MGQQLFRTYDGFGELAGRLELEANSELRHAERIVERVNSRDHAGRLRTSRRIWAAYAGDLLATLHEQAGREVASDFAGEEMFPTRASYIGYALGDYIGPHQDVQQCEVTLLVSIGSAHSLPIFDESLSDQPIEWISRRFREDDLAPDERLAVPTTGLLAIRGGQLIHARSRASVPAVTATLCYAAA